MVSHYPKLGAARSDLEALLQPLAGQDGSSDTTSSYEAGMLQPLAPEKACAAAHCVATIRMVFALPGQDCEDTSQAPAPFHVIPRGWAGANLLAMILFETFGQHQPLNGRPSAMLWKVCRSG